MRDFLISVTSVLQAKTRMAAWATKDEENKDVFRLPTWCDILPVDAYTDMGTPATYGDDGLKVKDPGTPPTLAPGEWFIVSLDRDVKMPDIAKANIVAEAEREEGLKLPDGIVGLSTAWAGMTIR